MENTNVQTVQPEQKHKSTQPVYAKATSVQRWIASFIDNIVFQVAIGIFFIVPEFFFKYKQIYGESWYQYFIELFLVSYLLWKFGATPGKMLLRIKVVDMQYNAISFKQALLRESIGKFVSGIFFSLGYFWMLIDKRKQTWHDKIAKTFVVVVDKKGHLIPITKDAPITRANKIVFFLLIFFQMVLVIAAIFLVIYGLLFRPFQMAGNAMFPNYINGEYFVTQLKPQNLQRGDVIVYTRGTKEYFVKRIIGLPGESILLQDNKIYINNKLLDENAYLPKNTQTYGNNILDDNDSGKSVTLYIQKDQYFVIGDNRAQKSNFTKMLIDKSDVIGKVLFCYYNCSKR